MRAEAPGAAAVSRRDCETRQAATGPWPRESPGAPAQLVRQRRERSPPRRFAPAHVPIANGRVGFRHQLDPRLCDQLTRRGCQRSFSSVIASYCWAVLIPRNSRPHLGHRRGKIAARYEGHFGPSLLRRQAQSDQGINVPKAAKRCQQDFHERTIPLAVAVDTSAQTIFGQSGVKNAMWRFPLVPLNAKKVSRLVCSKRIATRRDRCVQQVRETRALIATLSDLEKSCSSAMLGFLPSPSTEDRLESEKQTRSTTHAASVSRLCRISSAVSQSRSPETSPSSTRAQRRSPRWQIQPLLFVLLTMTWCTGDSLPERFETARAFTLHATKNANVLARRSMDYSRRSPSCQYAC